jgi:hypothetical protein
MTKNVVTTIKELPAGFDLRELTERLLHSAQAVFVHV